MSRIEFKKLSGRWRPLRMAAFVAIAGGALVWVPQVHYIWKALARRVLPDQIGSATPGAQDALAPITASSRNSSRPARVDVAVAQLGPQAIDSAAFELPMLADVGDRADAFLLQSPPSKTTGDQSDAENVDTRLEPSHVVAPVPMHEESLAAGSVQLASLVSEGHFAGGQISAARRLTGAFLRPAHIGQIQSLGTLPVARMDHQFDGSQVDGPSEAKDTPVLAATLTDAPAEKGFASECDWPLTDVTPLIDPSRLLRKMAPDDPLRRANERWLPEFKSTAEAPRLLTSQESIAMMLSSTLSWRDLYEMGRLSALLDQQSQRNVFWQSAILKAASAPADQTPAATDIHVMEILAGTFIREWPDNALASKGLEMLMQWERPGTRRLFQMTLLYASTLDRTGDRRAAEMIDPLMRLTTATPTLSGGDRFAARCVLSRVLFRQQRYREGLAFLAEPMIQSIRTEWKE